MKKPVAILFSFLGLLLLAGFALALFVHFYLTEERIKSLLIVPAEKALNRNVAIGEVKASILHGIRVENFSIKEEDGATDFATARSFILNYDLVSLLGKKLEISEIRLVEPRIRIHRAENGRFNLESLAFFNKGKEEQAAAPGSEAMILPVALAVDQIKVQNAVIILSDATEKLPAATANADLELALDLHDLSSISHKGTFSLQAEAVHGTFKPHFSGTGTFDGTDLLLQGELNLDQEQLQLRGNIKNYTNTPETRLDLSSKKLDLDHLVALLAGIPTTAHKLEKDSQGKNQPRSASDKKEPGSLLVSGDISVSQAIYRKLSIEDLQLNYAFKNGLFSISKMTAIAAGGKITARKIAVDLDKPTLAFQGETEIEGLDLNALGKALKPEGKEIFGGRLAGKFTLKGAGSEWEKIKQTLAGTGNYRISKGWFKNSGITASIADLLGLPELKDLKFDQAFGNITVENGIANLSCQIESPDLAATTQGSISLAGDLDLPIAISLSPSLSDRIQQRLSIARLLANEQGETVLRLKLKGTVDHPRPALDEKAARIQAEQLIQEKILKRLKKHESGSGETQEQKQEPTSPREILKGIFGL